MDAARETALKVLVKIDRDGAYSNMALKESLSGGRLTERDRHFATSLVYGTLDRRYTLDYIIGCYSKIKLKKLSVYVLNILRMGIYQLKFMDRVPDSAAVNESVNLAKRYAHGGSAGFVNGVLRSVIRGEIKYPSDKYEYLSVKYSYPVWLVKAWTKDYGDDFAEELMRAFSKPQKLHLRANTLKLSAAELALRLEKYNAEAAGDAVICDGFDISGSKLYSDGCFTVQDMAAQAAAICLAPEPGQTVIDMCAAPGGKTSHMAELMKNKGVIYAFDIYEHKTELINKNAKRLGISIIRAKCGDASVTDEKMLNTADKILCDVPCSGLGLVGRKPEIKWNREENAEELCELQIKILENAAKYLKSGGEILYSTCTLNKRENEGVTDKFTERNKSFKKIYEKTYYPHIDGTDGFYICKLKEG